MPMEQIAAEYLICVESLKQTMINMGETITNQEIKLKYEEIYEKLNVKYGRELVNTHWKCWNEVRRTMTRKDEDGRRLKRKAHSSNDDVGDRTYVNN